MEHGKPEKYRLFVAMSPPADVKNRIEKAQHQLRRTLPGNTIRWTKREQFHVTLKFLGNVAATRVGELTEALRNVCLGAGALRLRAERIGFFPGARVPRVLWVGVQDRQNLLPRLQARVEIGVKEFTKDEAAKPGSAGVSPASREKFTGHITLARIPRLRHSESEILSQAIADFADPFFGEWTANHVELIRSELSSSGSRYTTLAEIPLSEIQ
ncbi:MAG TPA: RNA 2',3'-cyclic phosphodiesterase [Verrucomicrobiae bacterium]|jgi:2'-5' RNA ligase|nr:RNA 2',3'-cyclic phosphodiesterase [Verrucomicrobiae bacterium]